jgi:hypothetical protein
MNRKRGIQRPRALAKVRRLSERGEAQASHSQGIPTAKRRSRANVRSRVAVMTLDGSKGGGNRGLSADALTFCLRVLMHLTLP